MDNDGCFHSVKHRNFAFVLVCPICKTTQKLLAAHLGRVCMKDAAEVVIAHAVDMAELYAREILRTGIVFSDRLIHGIMEDDRPVDRLAAWHLTPFLFFVFLLIFIHCYLFSANHYV